MFPFGVCAMSGDSKFTIYSRGSMPVQRDIHETIQRHLLTFLETGYLLFLSAGEST